MLLDVVVKLSFFTVEMQQYFTFLLHVFCFVFIHCKNALVYDSLYPVKIIFKVDDIYICCVKCLAVVGAQSKYFKDQNRNFEKCLI